MFIKNAQSQVREIGQKECVIRVIKKNWVMDFTIYLTAFFSMLRDKNFHLPRYVKLKILIFSMN